MTKNVTYPAGQLTCSVERCSNKLSVDKSDKFRATDEKHKTTAANGGQQDPRWVPVCSTCWASDHAVTLQMDCATPGKKMNMPAFRLKSGHAGGYKGAHSANAATAAAVDNSDNISDAGSTTSAASAAESAREQATAAVGGVSRRNSKWRQPPQQEEASTAAAEGGVSRRCTR